MTEAQLSIIIEQRVAADSGGITMFQIIRFSQLPLNDIVRPTGPGCSWGDDDGPRV